MNQQIYVFVVVMIVQLIQKKEKKYTNWLTIEWYFVYFVRLNYSTLYILIQSSFPGCSFFTSNTLLQFQTVKMTILLVFL